MTLLRRALLALASLTLLLAASITPAHAAPSDQDKTWMVSAHQSNLAEIAAGQAAQQSATTTGVREMGAQLVADHQKLDAELTAAASQFGVELPDSPTAAQQAALERVKAQSGAAFDAAWIAAQIEGHANSVAATEKQLANGSDDTVLGLAKTAAPVVQGHLDHLRRLAQEQGVPTSVPTGLDGPESFAALGGALLGAGLLAVVASLLIARRRHA